MNWRLFTALAAGALIVLGNVPAVAASTPTRSFERLDVSKIDPQIGPAVLRNRTVTVMVQLKGAPATARKAIQGWADGHGQGARKAG